MPVENDAADFAEVLAELEADEGPEADSAAPEAESVQGDQEASDELEETETEEIETETAEVDVEADRAEIAGLFSKGKLKEACEKLGLDPGIFRLNNRQFAAARAAETAAKALKAEGEAALSEGTAKLAKATELDTAARTTYGPIAVGAAKYAQGEHLAAKGAVELFFRDKFENIVANIARAAKGIDPAQAEVIRLRREIAERDAANTASTAAAASAAEEAGQVTTIAGKLKGTPLEGVDGAAEEIARVIRASKHPTLNKYTVTLKEAYVQVKAAHAKKAAQLAKLLPGARPAPVVDKRRPLDRTPLAARRPVEKKVDPDEEFRRELEAAARDTAAQERKNRRSK